MSSRRPGAKKAASKPAGAKRASSRRAASKRASAKDAGAGRSASERPASERPARDSGHEYSAGGVVVRDREVVVIVPTRRAADGSRVLALPKGHVDNGESPLEAAEREVREETGVRAEPVSELGESRYWYRRDGRTIGKRVTFYLFKYLEGDTADHDEEVEEAFWIDLTAAQEQLTHAAERDMVGLALAYLEKDR
jgi:8-oxo-dGTP diphosphatase